MKIEVTALEEHKDGSATCSVALDKDGVRFLVNLGLVTALMEAVDNYKNLEPYDLKCDSDDPDDMCKYCDCWKHTRAMCG